MKQSVRLMQALSTVHPGPAAMLARHYLTSLRGKSTALASPLVNNRLKEEGFTPVANNDFSAQSLYTRFRALEKNNRYSQISNHGPKLIRELEIAYGLDSNNLQLKQLLGQACTLYGRTKVNSAEKAEVDEAICCLERAVQLSPDNKEADSQLQWKLMLRGKPSTIGVLRYTAPRDPLEGHLDGIEEESSRTP